MYLYGYRSEYKYQTHTKNIVNPKQELIKYPMEKRKFGKKSLQVIELISRVEVFAIFMSFHKWPQSTEPFVPFTIRENISHAIHLLFIESLINFQCFWFLFRTRFGFVCVVVVCQCLLMFVLVLLHWEFSYYFVLREIVMLGRYLSIMELRYLCLRVELALIYLRSWKCTEYSIIYLKVLQEQILFSEGNNDELNDTIIKTYWILLTTRIVYTSETFSYTQQ